MTAAVDTFLHLFYLLFIILEELFYKIIKNKNILKSFTKNFKKCIKKTTKNQSYIKILEKFF